MAQIGGVADARETSIGTDASAGNSQQLSEIVGSGDIDAAARFVRQQPGQRAALESALLAAGRLGLIYELNQSVAEETAAQPGNDGGAELPERFRAIPIALRQTAGATADARGGDALTFQDRLRADIVSNPDFRAKLASGEVRLADVDALMNQPAIREAARFERFTGAFAATRLTEAQADYAIRAFALGRDVTLNPDGTIAVGADGEVRLQPVRLADASGRLSQVTDPGADPRSTAQIVADYARQFNTTLAELANSRFGSLVSVGFEALSLAMGGPMKYLLMKVFERGAEHLFEQGVMAAAPFIASQFGLSNEDAAHVAIAGVTAASLVLGSRDVLNTIRNLPNSVQQVARHVQLHMVGGPDGPRGPRGTLELDPGTFTSRFTERPTWVASQREVGRYLGPDWQPQAGFLDGQRLPSGRPPGTPPQNPRPPMSTFPDFYNPRLNVAAEVKNYDLARNYQRMIDDIKLQASGRIISMPGHAAAERWLFVDLRGQAVGDLAQLANRIHRDLGNGSVYRQTHFILDDRIARAI